MSAASRALEEFVCRPGGSNTQTRLDQGDQQQEQRSQIQNRATAMIVLATKLLERKRQEELQAMDDIRGVKADVAFGSQIRNYVLQPYQMVKDLRTGMETGATGPVLDGEIDEFIEAAIRWQAGRSEGWAGPYRVPVTRILVIDNYDSFVFNLVQYLGQLGADCVVHRNDDPAALDVAGADGVLLSPGPGTPEQAGACVEIVDRCEQAGVPLLGVCLGHQAIAVAHGAKVSRAPELMHGRTSDVVHQGAGVLHELPSPFTATRYHSLAVEEDTLPPELQVTARTPEGVVMALRHRDKAVEGVQFHPESVLTQGGHVLLASWLRQCGDPTATDRAPALSAVVARRLMAFG